MGYTISQLAKLAGISTRTLRYYHQCGLLTPHRSDANNYRIYDTPQIDRLQQILFYKELGIPLDDIKKLLDHPSFKPLPALQGHLEALLGKKQQLELLILNVQDSIRAMEGEITMKDHEKFIGFKERLIASNEEEYGQEIRQKYGNETVDASNEKIRQMPKEEFEKWMQPRLDDALKAACQTKDPAGELAQNACALHKEWLCHYWPDGMYSPQMHLNMGQMYVEDERFAAYYEKIHPGLSQFLFEALKTYCSKKSDRA